MLNGMLISYLYESKETKEIQRISRTLPIWGRGSMTGLQYLLPFSAQVGAFFKHGQLFWSAPGPQANKASTDPQLPTRLQTAINYFCFLTETESYLIISLRTPRNLSILKALHCVFMTIHLNL